MVQTHFLKGRKPTNEFLLGTEVGHCLALTHMSLGSERERERENKNEGQRSILVDIQTGSYNRVSTTYILDGRWGGCGQGC